MSLDAAGASARSLRRVSVATLVTGGFLLMPAAALGEVDSNSVTTQAEVEAQAWNGKGDQDDNEVVDRSGRGGFSEFLRTVSARDTGRGRLGKGEAFQDTRIVEEGSEFLGVDSQGTMGGRFADSSSALAPPIGSGRSELEVGFDVVNAPVKFTLTGTIEASVPAPTGPHAAVTVSDPSGAESTVEIGSFDSGTDATSLDLTGTLNPGSHTLEVNAAAFAGGLFNTSGAAAAEYDLELRFCTIVAAQPGDPVAGTSGDDVICGRSGDEQLLGAGGNDRIFGFGGADEIDGGEGSDMISGGDGDDTRLYGGPGNDVIDGGLGNDGPGAPSVTDVVAGGPGNDVIDGGPGNDRIYGRCGEFLLGDPSPVCPDDPPAPGEDDEDKLIGRSGADVLFGDAQRDVIFAGNGDDPLVEGFAGPDLILGGAGGDSLDGGEGNDDIFGDEGPDTLLGDAGADCLDGGSGEDDFSGGNDDDTLVAKGGGRDTGSGGPAPDRGRFDPTDTIASVANRNFQGGC